MKKVMLILFCLFGFAGLSFAGATSSLPFTKLTTTADIGKPYGMATIEIECSSSKDNISRKFTKLVIKTQEKEFTAPASMLVPFNNPGDVMIHGGVINEEVNLIFQYEKTRKRFAEGRIRFKNGAFNVW